MNLLQGLGQSQPVTGFINTALHVQQSQNQTALMEQQQKLNDIKLAQDQRNAEWLDVTEVNRKATESGHGGAVSLGIKRSMEMGLHKDVPGPDGTIRTFMRRNDISAGVDAVGQDTKAQPAILSDRENYLTAQMDALEKKSGDPKFKAQYDELAAERRMIRKKLYGLDEDKGTVVPAGATLIRPGQEPYTAPKEAKVSAVFANENGDIVKQMEDGSLVNEMGDPYDGDPSGLIKVGQDKPPKEPISDFATFYRGEKEKNPNTTDADISTAWHKMKVAEAKAVGEARIPAFAQGSGLPPGYVFNRRTGAYEWKGEGAAPGMDPSSAAGYKADVASLTNQTKIRDMMSSFVKNMNSQIVRMETILNDVTRLDTRLINVPIRKWAMTVRGTAAESKVSMYLTEISNEIGKLSTGSAASVQELSQTAQAKWDKIHDPNLSAKEMISLLKETQHAGDLRMKSVDDTIADTKKRIGGGASAAGADPYGIR